MAAGGIGTLRISMPWSAVDPTPAEDEWDWSGIDPIVAGAAAEGVQVLPFLYGTPEWVAADLDGRRSCGGDCGPFAPRSEAALGAWREFVGAAVDRYGPGGELWAEQPDLPAEPIRQWQVWNEQNSATFYAPRPSISGYLDLLAAAEEAIHERDPRATVILGGMFGTPPDASETAGTAWEYLQRMYAKRDAEELFDGVAAHPYAANLEKLESQVELLHDATVRAGDDGASLWVTELGWASGGRDVPLNKGPAGQAERLSGAFEFLLAHRADWNVETVTWYSWRDSSEPPVCDWCPKSGLLEADLSEKPAWAALTRLTGGG